MSNKRAWFVYWLHENHHKNPRKKGYVGATCSLARRIARHSLIDTFPAFKVKILLRGSQEECHALEKELRPDQSIGWNKRAGGPTYIGERGKGKPKSPEHREKMRQAALRRYQDPKEHAKTSRAVKKGLPKNHSEGENNSRYGKKMSEASKAKMRATIAASGGRSGDRNPNYKG